MTQPKPESAKIVLIVLMIVMEFGLLGRPARPPVALVVPHEHSSSPTVQKMVVRIAMLRKNATSHMRSLETKGMLMGVRLVDATGGTRNMMSSAFLKSQADEAQQSDKGK